jgi:hypothetical protein
MKAEPLTPTIPGADVKRMSYTYGPFKLRGVGGKRAGNSFSLDPQGTAWNYLASDFPRDITVLEARMKIHFEDGTPISNSAGVYNHHAFFYDITKPMKSNLECEGMPNAMLPAINSISGSAADSGAERPMTTTRLVTGNYVSDKARVLIMGDLVNYNNDTRDVYMVNDMQYVEGKASGLLETRVHLLSVMTCESIKKGPLGILGGLFIRPPTGQKKFSLAGNGLQVKDEGKLLLLRGHMHDGGVNFKFNLNGEEVCDSRAQYNAAAVGGAGGMGGMGGGHAHGGAESKPVAPKDGGGMTGGMLSDMGACSKYTDVKKGDKISMEAFYDLDLHPG